MSYEIYFDESLKIDKKASNFSFYGIIGIEYKNRKQIESIKDEIGFRSEFHFSEFKISQMEYYLDILRKTMDLFESKIYVVDTEFAFDRAKKLSIDEKVLRKLFYVKIPERLIYGMTRYIPEPTDINIFIDKSPEYGNDNLEFFNDESRMSLMEIVKNSNTFDEKCKEIELLVKEIYNHVQLTKTLKEQLNSQSLYRNLNYKINVVQQKDSKEFIGLQISDIILGILGFLFEEKYLDMPPEIQEDKMNSILRMENLAEYEIQFITDNYKLNPKNKIYNLQIKQNELKKIKRLRDLNKKIGIHSNKNISKSELVYRVLSDEKILNKLHNINIFMWPSKDYYAINNKVDKMFFSHYINSFLNFKHKFDNENKKKILNYHNDSIDLAKYKINDYTDYIELPHNLNNITHRYLSELNMKCLD